MSDPAPATAMPVTLRPASVADARLLFDWANRDDSIASSLVTQGPIQWEKHRTWFEARLQDRNCRIWILEVSGRPAGQIRLQDKGEGPEVSIYVEPQDRGQDTAATALGIALKQAGAIWPGTRILARVRHDNAASQAFFRKTGFADTERQSDHLILCLDPIS
jgi:UDP-2,4-diacetamido-2,4,6-trideoxy-beta-L-altropyranose hydrolase